MSSKVKRMVFLFAFVFVIGKISESLGMSGADTDLALETPTDVGMLEGMFNTVEAFAKLLSFQIEGIPTDVNLFITSVIAIIILWTIAEMVRGN